MRALHDGLWPIGFREVFRRPQAVLRQFHACIAIKKEKYTIQAVDWT